MKSLLLILLVSSGYAADAVTPSVTVDDLQNLVVCARLQLKDLTPQQIQSMAIAIAHAESDIAAMRAAASIASKAKRP